MLACVHKGHFHLSTPDLQDIRKPFGSILSANEHGVNECRCPEVGGPLGPGQTC